MRPITRSLLTVVAFLTALAPAGGQTRVVRAGDAPPSPRDPLAAVRGPLTADEERTIARWLDESDAMIVVGRYAEARRLLRSVRDLQVQAGAYPSVTLRRLANVEFGLGNEVAAAGVLEELASAACAAHDPVTELQALLDATVLYGQEGKRAKVRELQPRVRKMLASPAIPDAMRQSVARHLDHE